MKPDESLPPPPLLYRILEGVMWPLLKLMRVTCEDAFHLCDKRMDRELGAWESLRLRFHLMICGLCRRIPMQSLRIRELLRLAEQADPEMPVEAKLSDDAKMRIAAHLREHGTRPS